MPYKDKDDPRAIAYRQKRVQATADWRRDTKDRMVRSMGGCCQICGYDKTYAALELHHIDPEEKEIQFGHIIANPTKLENIINELKKCILLCANCHREIHAGVTQIPLDFTTVDETIMRDTRAMKRINAAREIAARRAHEPKPDRRKIKLNDDEFLHLHRSCDSNNIETARRLGVSETAIRKRLKKIGG